MPQFELANALPQVAWLLVIFTLLYVALAAVLPRVERVAEQRASVIGEDLTEAERARERASLAAEEVERQLADARSRAANEAAEARAAAAREAEMRLKAIEAEMDARQAQAEARIGAAREEALANLDTVAGEATAEIVESLTGLRPGRERVSWALASARGAEADGKSEAEAA